MPNFLDHAALLLLEFTKLHTSHGATFLHIIPKIIHSKTATVAMYSMP